MFWPWCVVSCNTVLHGTVLHCNALYCVSVFCTLLCCNPFYFDILCFSLLSSIFLYSSPSSLQPFPHRCLVGDLSIFYRYFNGHCSQEIRDIFPVPLRRVRTTRSSTHSHPFQVSLPTSRTLSHKSSFIPRICNLWDFLPSSCFPESYNLPSFKSKINKLDLISLSSELFAFFFLSLLGLCIGHRSLSST